MLRRGFVIFVCFVTIFAFLLTSEAMVAVAADYVAYAVVDKREDQPLPESLSDIDDKYLIKFRWGDYDGPQIRVGVLPVENTSSASSVKMRGPDGQTFEWSASYANQVPVQQIGSMLSDVMFHSGRFEVLEREVLNDVLYEQDLGDSGRVAKQSAAKIGRVTGADYLIKGAVTHYEPNFKGNAAGLGGLTPGLLGGVGFGKKKSLVGMVFKLIDAETGKLVDSKQVAAVTSKTRFSIGALGWGGGGAAGGAFSSFSKEPIGQAIIACINKGVYEMVKRLGSEPARGAIIKVDDDGQVLVNMGKDETEVGETFKAQSKGEELIDPTTGESLGSELEDIGTITVTRVLEKFSYAQANGFDASQLSAGDRIVSTKAPEPLQFAAEWEKPRRKSRR